MTFYLSTSTKTSAKIIPSVTRGFQLKRLSKQHFNCPKKLFVPSKIKSGNLDLSTSKTHLPNYVKILIYDLNTQTKRTTGHQKL